MGQHKFNQTAIDAKEGKLPPKKKRMGKRQRDRLLYNKIQSVIEDTLINGVDKYFKKPRIEDTVPITDVTDIEGGESHEL